MRTNCSDMDGAKSAIERYARRLSYNGKPTTATDGADRLNLFFWHDTAHAEINHIQNREIPDTKAEAVLVGYGGQLVGRATIFKSNEKNGYDVSFETGPLVKHLLQTVIDCRRAMKVENAAFVRPKVIAVSCLQLSILQMIVESGQTYYYPFSAVRNCEDESLKGPMGETELLSSLYECAMLDKTLSHKNI